MTTILKSRRASTIPGSTLRELTAPATDRFGRVWPRGTLYQPISAGRDNGRGHGSQEVTIGHERVTFHAEEAAR